MDETNEIALFRLSAIECDERIAHMSAPYVTAYPVRCAVAAALMVAEAATQRIALTLGRRVTSQIPWPEYESLPEGSFEFVEKLMEVLFEPKADLEGQPLRIDLVSWDAAGYIFGWYLDDQDKPFIGPGSCPETVRKLAAALWAFAPCDVEWRSMLERHATVLNGLWLRSRERAELLAAEKVASQSWWSKLTKPTTMNKELLSLGFGDAAT